MRELKFRVVRFNEKGPYILGYERLNNAGDWEWMCLDLNPDKGERWTPGVLVTGYTYKRDQFTGLKDKNGKEIYEGDIVECHDHPTGVDNTIGPVIFEHGHYKVNGYALHDYGTAWTEVKGNIHQNPELL